MNLAVQMTGVTQKFGPVTALDQVELQVKQQTIHALVGENGAGKTTLMRILYGALQPTFADLKLHGQPYRPATQKQAIAQHVGMVSQHYSIIPELTCLQNLMLGAEPGWTISQEKAKERAQDLAASMGFTFDWDQEARGIGPAQAQKLEILKLLWRKADLLILDEPTALLSPDDADRLYANLRQLVGQGKTVIVVTHRLPEVMRFCDEVTVLRAGRLVGSKPVSQTNPDELTTMIVGQPVHIEAPTPFEPGKILLQAQNLTVQGLRGEDALKSVSFELREGEMVGLAGVDGNGQRELFQALWGLAPAKSGQIQLEGQDATRTKTRDRIAAGLRLIPEDRHEEAVIEEWSIEENGVLGLHRLPGLTAEEKKNIANRVTTLFPTKFDNVHQPFKGLSGGNQQKVVNARAFQLSPKVILAFQPTRGIDINVSALVFKELRHFARQGGAVLVVSFDIDELLTHCDRILVINHGQVTEPAPDQARDRQAIGRLMVGAQTQNAGEAT